MSRPGVDPHLANVFEDDNGIRRESGFLRRFSALELRANGHGLPDGYGVAWVMPNCAQYVCAPLPWHRLFGWAYRVYWRWKVWTDPSVLELVYADGLVAGSQRGPTYERFSRQRAAHRLDVEHAYENGVKDQFEYLERQLTARQKGSLD